MRGGNLAAAVAEKEKEEEHTVGHQHDRCDGEGEEYRPPWDYHSGGSGGGGRDGYGFGGGGGHGGTYGGGGHCGPPHIQTPPPFKSTRPRVDRQGDRVGKWTAEEEEFAR